MGITDKSVELVVTKLSVLAEKLGMTIENIYPYFVKQQIIYGLTALVAFVVSIIGLSISIKKLCDADSWENNDFTPKGVISLITTIFFGIIFLASVINLTIDGMGQLLNPNYAAITKLISLIK